jgi:hypothetical protein
MMLLKGLPAGDITVTRLPDPARWPFIHAFPRSRLPRKKKEKKEKDLMDRDSSAPT